MVAVRSFGHEFYVSFCCSPYLCRGHTSSTTRGVTDTRVVPDKVRELPCRDLDPSCRDSREESVLFDGDRTEDLFPE